MDTSPDTGDLKQFRLVVDVDPEVSDWPRLSILVDSQNPFHDAAPGWEGFDPDEMLAGVSVLLPQHPWRRVAVARCSCGIEGCGVIAPLIVERAGVVTWTDFRDYTGVFVGPLPHAGPDPHGGSAWPVTEIRFAASQYRDEVARAVADRSWENSRRATARLLRPRIEDLLADISASDIVAFILVPSWKAGGLNLTLRRKGAGGADTWWEYLRLEAPCTDPVTDATHSSCSTKDATGQAGSGQTSAAYATRPSPDDPSRARRPGAPRPGHESVRHDPTPRAAPRRQRGLHGDRQPRPAKSVVTLDRDDVQALEAHQQVTSGAVAAGHAPTQRWLAHPEISSTGAGGGRGVS